MSALEETIKETIAAHDLMLKRLWCIAYEEGQNAKREWVDMTPIELAEAFSDKGSADAGIRAVIAAYREKNK